MNCFTYTWFLLYQDNLWWNILVRSWMEFLIECTSREEFRSKLCEHNKIYPCLSIELYTHAWTHAQTTLLHSIIGIGCLVTCSWPGPGVTFRVYKVILSLGPGRQVRVWYWLLSEAFLNLPGKAAFCPAEAGVMRQYCFCSQRLPPFPRGPVDREG